MLLKAADHIATCIVYVRISGTTVSCRSPRSNRLFIRLIYDASVVLQELRDTTPRGCLSFDNYSQERLDNLTGLFMAFLKVLEF